MIDENCKHSGTMTLTPCEDKGWEVLPWCFYLEREIKGDCLKDCPHREQMQKLVDNKDDGDGMVTLARGHHVRNADGSVTDVSNDPRYKCKED